MITISWTRAGVQLAAEHKTFDPDQPRDAHGRWIKVGSRVTLNLIAGGGTGTVRTAKPGGRFDVQRDDGSTVADVDGAYLTVIDADEPVDLLDVLAAQAAEQTHAQTAAADNPAAARTAAPALDPHAARLAKMDPPQIDAELHAILTEESKAEYAAATAMTSMHRLVEGDPKKDSYGKPLPWKLSDEDALLKARHLADGTTGDMPHRVLQAEAAVTRYEEALADARAAAAKAAPHNAEFVRRGGWERAFLVVGNGDGHVHDTNGENKRRCPSWRWNTRYDWITDLSGKTHTEIIAAIGEQACTICYPDAPVARGEAAGPRTAFTAAEKATGVEKAKADVEKNAKRAEKDAKKITNPDGTPLLRNTADTWDVVNSVVTAQNEYAATIADLITVEQQLAETRQGVARATRDVANAHPDLAETAERILTAATSHAEDLQERVERFRDRADRFLAALAAKYGRTPDEQADELAEKVRRVLKTKRVPKELWGRWAQTKAHHGGAPAADPWLHLDRAAGLETKLDHNWDSDLHPRDARGRFLKVGGRVRISAVAGGGEGTVRGLGQGGTIDVERDNGQRQPIAKGYLTVLEDTGVPDDPATGRREDVADVPGQAAPLGGGQPMPDAERLAAAGVPTVPIPALSTVTDTMPPPAAPTPDVPASAPGPSPHGALGVLGDDAPEIAEALQEYAHGFAEFARTYSMPGGPDGIADQMAAVDPGNLLVPWAQVMGRHDPQVVRDAIAAHLTEHPELLDTPPTAEVAARKTAKETAARTASNAAADAERAARVDAAERAQQAAERARSDAAQAWEAQAEQLRAAQRTALTGAGATIAEPGRVDELMRDGLPPFGDYRPWHIKQTDQGMRASAAAKHATVTALTAEMADVPDEDLLTLRGRAELDQLRSGTVLARKLHDPNKLGPMVADGSVPPNPDLDYDTVELSAADPVPDGYDIVSADQRRAELRQSAVNDMVALWAINSGGLNARSQAMQEIAADLFAGDDTGGVAGFDDIYGEYPELAREIAQIIAERGAAMRAFLTAQHAATQRWFAQQGITHVRVFRGQRHWDFSGPLPEWAVGADAAPKAARVPLRPLSSFSSDASIAAEFAHGNRESGEVPLLMEAVVPVGKILSSPRTGVGALEEAELVVVGHDTDWMVRQLDRLETKAMAADQAGQAGGHPPDGHRALWTAVVNENWTSGIWDATGPNGAPLTDPQAIADILGVHPDQLGEELPATPALGALMELHDLPAPAWPPRGPVPYSAPPAEGAADPWLGVETKLRGSWDSDLHPRDAKGRFIKIGARVHINPVAGGGDGTVRGLSRNLIDVERDSDHRITPISKGYLTVLEEADGGATGRGRAHQPGDDQMAFSFDPLPTPATAPEAAPKAPEAPEAPDALAANLFSGAPPSLHPAIDRLPRITRKYEDSDDVERNLSINHDARSTNPSFGEPGFGVNCVHVVNAHELRRRGYDVTATALPEAMRPAQGRDAQEALDRWRAPDGSRHTRSIQVGSSLKDITEYAQKWPDGARGWVQVYWSRDDGGGGHIFNIEMVDGQLRFIDAQLHRAEADMADYQRRARRNRAWSLVRVDDLVPTDAVQEFINER